MTLIGALLIMMFALNDNALAAGHRGMHRQHHVSLEHMRHHRGGRPMRFAAGRTHRSRLHLAWTHGGHRYRSRQVAFAEPRTAASQFYRYASGGVQTGRASFYSGGGRTASGAHVGAATCAHRSLPFGTRVLVTNLANLRQAILTVNDRGPFVRGRLVDVSRSAAGVLGMLASGVASVRLQVLGRPS